MIRLLLLLTTIEHMFEDNSTMISHYKGAIIVSLKCNSTCKLYIAYHNYVLYVAT